MNYLDDCILKQEQSSKIRRFKVKALTDYEMTARHYEAGVTDYVANETYGSKAYIFAEFDPNFNLSINQAAELAGYDSFNGMQNTTSDTEKHAVKT